MKRFSHLYLSAFALILCAASFTATAGATKESPSVANQPPPPTIEKDWGKAVQSLKSDTAEQRQQALETGKRTLDAMDERLDSLQEWTSSHWDSLSDSARKKQSEIMKEMREQRNKVAEWYGGMKHSSAEAWEDVKQGFISSYDKLRKTYDRTVNSLSKEQAEDSSDNDQSDDSSG